MKRKWTGLFLLLTVLVCSMTGCGRAVGTPPQPASPSSEIASSPESRLPSSKPEEPLYQPTAFLPQHVDIAAAFGSSSYILEDTGKAEQNGVMYYTVAVKPDAEGDAPAQLYYYIAPDFAAIYRFDPAAGTLTEVWVEEAK